MGFNSAFKGLIEQHSKFLLHTLQVLYMCTLCDSTNINTTVLKSGSLNLLEPLGPVQACNRIALPFHLIFIYAPM